MEFETAAQRTCYTQVKVWMQEIFGRSWSSMMMSQSLAYLMGQR